MMTLTRQTVEQVDELGLPWDLRDWITPEELLRTLLQQLESIDWKDPALVDFEKKHPAFRPKMFLTLLPYAYATGMYASEDIAEGSYTDPIFRSICAAEAPTAREITAFRRQNRGLLQWLLTELFKQALKSKYDIGNFLVPPGLKRCLTNAATERLDICRHIARGPSDD